MSPFSASGNPAAAQGGRGLPSYPGSYLPPLLPIPSGLSQGQGSSPRCSHLFDVEVGAGTCFVEVHTILLSQLQDKGSSEREAVREGGPCHLVCAAAIVLSVCATVTG